ncbi:TrmB family transcriptional regulator [Halorubraceae archaeon YAN]|nr:TrmB family transcriptional regulator [Halorubraceae archaeon YAN]
MDDSTLSDLLHRFGFSDKEVDTYLTLLAHGEAKASTIAEAAGVSKRYVYSVSEVLEDRGFVDVNDHVVPTMIRARDPEEVIARLTADVESMKPGLKERFAKTEPAVEQFEVIKSRVTVTKRIKTLITEAETELTISVPQPVLTGLRSELTAAVDRGVLVLLIVSGTDDAPEDAQSIASVTRVWRELMPTMVAVDRQLGLVAPAEMLIRANSGKQAIVFAQEQLGPVIVGSFFGNYWPVADEVAVADPDELPVTYTDFRRAVFQATLWLWSDSDLWVTVSGRSTETNEHTTVSGRVVDVVQGIVAPVNNTFPVENSLTIETEDEALVTVGGRGAFVEDIEAESVTLALSAPN